MLRRVGLGSTDRGLVCWWRSQVGIVGWRWHRLHVVARLLGLVEGELVLRPGKGGIEAHAPTTRHEPLDSSQYQTHAVRGQCRDAYLVVG